MRQRRPRSQRRWPRGPPRRRRLRCECARETPFVAWLASSQRIRTRTPKRFADTGPVSFATELRMVGDRAQFLVHTDEPDYRRALVDLAFEEHEDGFVRSFPAQANGLHESYLRFKLTLGDVLDHASGRRLPPWEDALDAVAVR